MLIIIINDSKIINQWNNKFVTILCGVKVYVEGEMNVTSGIFSYMVNKKSLIT